MRTPRRRPAPARTQGPLRNQRGPCSSPETRRCATGTARRSAYVATSPREGRDGPIRPASRARSDCPPTQELTARFTNHQLRHRLSRTALSFLLQVGGEPKQQRRPGSRTATIQKSCRYAGNSWYSMRMRPAIARLASVSSARSSASSAARPSVEMWWGGLPATAQRLWLTNSMLWPSGSSTNTR